jgi:hypothetical protein
MDELKAIDAQLMNCSTELSNMRAATHTAEK